MKQEPSDVGDIGHAKTQGIQATHEGSGRGTAREVQRLQGRKTIAAAGRARANRDAVPLNGGHGVICRVLSNDPERRVLAQRRREEHLNFVACTRTYTRTS